MDERRVVEVLRNMKVSALTYEESALDHAIATIERQRWRPIESAPKDGTDIILGAGTQKYQGAPVAPRVTVGHWTTDEECRIPIGDCGGECHCTEYEYDDPCWLSWDGGFTAENPPTHWRPLPDPQPDGQEVSRW